MTSIDYSSFECRHSVLLLRKEGGSHRFSCDKLSRHSGPHVASTCLQSDCYGNRKLQKKGVKHIWQADYLTNGKSVLIQNGERWESDKVLVPLAADLKFAAAIPAGVVYWL
jgi:hypothetical protein